MRVFILITIALAIIIFFIGMYIGHHIYAKRMSEAYGGVLIVDLSTPEANTLSVDFEKNPKELLKYHYILMEVKIRE